MNTPKAVIQAVENSTLQGAIIQAPGVDGYSGEKIIGLLQRLAIGLAQDECYLEIGVFRGLTLVSVAAAARNVVCYGVDDFSQFDPRGENKAVVLNALERLSLANAQLINSDFEAALLNLRQHIGPRKLGVYFIDGPHDYRSQYLCLDFARPHLSERAAIIVDDANYEHVRRSSRDWLLANPDYALAFEAYTECHPANMSPERHLQARAGWWNGVNVIVRDPDRTLRPTYPPVNESRAPYFNEHIVHASRWAPMSAEVMSAFSKTSHRAWVSLASLLRRRPGTDLRRYEAMNTDSASIAGERRVEFL